MQNAKTNKCGNCFYWLKPTQGMILGQCQFWQFLAQPASAPKWTTPDMLPIAWRSAAEGVGCGGWDERDYDIAEHNLPGAMSYSHAQTD